MASRKWTTEENSFLMESAHRVPWSQIAETVGRSEIACKKHFDKIMKLRRKTGTWRGI